MQEGANAKQQIVEKLKSSTNILVTVSTNPSVDELSAALSLTLMLNKMDKHATAVFSGVIPPAIEFLNPEKTLENTVDSLRDFIIALDKEKADRLRYKVDGDMVRIFITPYRTTISEKDLEFSQGDFNVEAIVALGVEQREDLDKAIAAHGRILHDATVVTIDTKQGDSDLGSIDWQDPNASSLCEMLMSLSEALQGGLVDEQIATALLTGIVAATDRFSNDHTKPRVMTMAAQLMAAGANQQLIATKLEGDNIIRPKTNTDGSTNLKEDSPAKVKPEQKKPQEAEKPKTAKKPADGEMHIDHHAQPETPEQKQPNLVDASVAMTPEAIQQNKQQAAMDAAEEALDKALPQPVAQPETPKQSMATLADLERQLEEERKKDMPEPAPVSEEPIVPPSVPEAEETPPPSAPAKEQRAAGSAPSWMGKRIEPPTMGGTLSATSEEALHDKLREEEEERNHMLLSHSDRPLNEEKVIQPLPPAAETPQPPALPPLPPQQPISPAAPSLPTFDASLAPPAPAPIEPSLQEGAADAASQPPLPNMDGGALPPPPAASDVSDLTNARDAVNAALNDMGVAAEPSPATPPPPPAMPQLPPAQPSEPAAPPAAPLSMPTPPPLPDMGALPPLPPMPAPGTPNTGFGPVPGTPTAQPDPFGPPPLQPGGNPNDPGQFKIPGQP